MPSSILPVPLRPGGSLDLGPGVNTLTRDVTGVRAADWVIDNAGSAQVPPAQPLVELTGQVTNLRLFGQLPRGASVTFLGTSQSEHLELTMTGAHVVLRLRGGDDLVETGCGTLADPSVISAGPGRDRLVPDFCGAARVDLGRHLLDVGARTPTKAGTVTGVEDVVATGTSLVLAGDGKDNVIRVDACAYRLDGGRGADRIIVPFVFPRRPSCGQVHALYGGAGNDYLRGGDYDELLVGGRGVDRAYGNGGRDACGAEKTYACEVTR